LGNRAADGGGSHVDDQTSVIEGADFGVQQHVGQRAHVGIWGQQARQIGVSEDAVADD
jgi:hypothetical protein